MAASSSAWMAGYIRDRDDRKKNFELIVGRSLPEVGAPRYIGFVHGYDRRPQRAFSTISRSRASKPIRISPSSPTEEKRSARSPR